jgi:hypothetical protein
MESLVVCDPEVGLDLDPESESETGIESEAGPMLRQTGGQAREGHTLVLKSILREIVANARESGESPARMLDEKAGIGPELLALAVVLEADSMDWWRRNLPQHHNLLAILEILQQLVVEKMPLASVNDKCGVHSTDPQLNDRYRWWMSAVETAIVRRSNHPEQANELGYEDEPGYDGGAFYDDLLDLADPNGEDPDERSPKFWCRVTQIVAWPSKRPIVTLDELRSAYRAGLDWPKGKLNFPFEVSSDVSWWLRNHRPVLERKIVFRGKAKMTTWGQEMQQQLRKAADLARTGPANRQALKALIRQWLGPSSEVLNHVEDPISEAVRLIGTKIRRSVQRKIDHPIGIVWLPGWIGGDVPTAWIQREVARLTKETGEPDAHWALQAFYDPEGAEDAQGRAEVRPGLRALLQKHGAQAPKVLHKARSCDFCG